MNPPYAVAGRDIEADMTIIVEPGGEPIRIWDVELTGTGFVRLYYVGGERPEVVRDNQWYAEVER